MHPETAISQFEAKLSSTLDGVDYAFSHWGRDSKAVRSTHALALLFKVITLLDEAEELTATIEESFPPVSLTADKNWQKSIRKVKKDISLMAPYNGDDSINLSLETIKVLADESKAASLTSLANRIVKSEATILCALTAAYDSLLQTLITIDAMQQEDRSQQYALLYAAEYGKYHNRYWHTEGRLDEERKLLNHISNRYPFGPAPADKLKEMYEEEYKAFSKTTLGAIYDIHQENTVALASAIAASHCTSKDLQDYFRTRCRLQKYIELATTTAQPQNPAITVNIDTFHNHPGAQYIDNSGQPAQPLNPPASSTPQIEQQQ